MRSRKPITVCLLLGMVAFVCLGFAACLEVRNDDDVDGGGDGCGMCHEEMGTSGAHAVHVGEDGLFGGGYSCEDCHLVPTDWFDPGHVNGVVEVVFAEGGLAATGGLTPTWDGAKCSNVYCHGATLGGGNYVEPIWVDESLPNGLACGDCHGVPPLQPHPASGACSQCHGDAYTNGELDRTVHINGVVDFGGDGGEQ